MQILARLGYVTVFDPNSEEIDMDIVILRAIIESHKVSCWLHLINSNFICSAHIVEEAGVRSDMGPRGYYSRDL